MFEESNDRTRRACKVIILGHKESDSSSQKEVKKHDLRLTDQILKEAEVDLLLNETQFFWLGKRVKDNKPRPVKLCVSSKSVAIIVFRNFSPKNIDNTDLKDVIISRDRTLKERQHLCNLRDTLNARIESGETDLTIKYVNNTRKKVSIKKLISSSGKNILLFIFIT